MQNTYTANSPNRKKQKRGPIFVSPYKSGTTSIAEALRMVGFSIIGHEPHLISPRLEGSLQAANRIVQHYDSLDAIPQNIQKGLRLILAEVELLMRRADVYHDWPLGHDLIDPFIKKLLIPDSCFIFLDRNGNEWIESVISHDRWLYGDDSGARSPEGDSFLLTYRDLLRKRYQLLEACCPGSVLFMQAIDGWAPLAPFLGFSPPPSDFPILNRSSDRSSINLTPNRRSFRGGLKAALRKILGRISAHVWA